MAPGGLLPMHDSPSRYLAKAIKDRDLYRWPVPEPAEPGNDSLSRFSLFQPDKLTGMECSPADGGYRKPCDLRGFR